MIGKKKPLLLISLFVSGLLSYWLICKYFSETDFEQVERIILFLLLNFPFFIVILCIWTLNLGGKPTNGVPPEIEYDFDWRVYWLLTFLLTPNICLWFLTSFKIEFYYELAALTLVLLVSLFSLVIYTLSIILQLNANKKILAGGSKVHVKLYRGVFNFPTRSLFVSLALFFTVTNHFGFIYFFCNQYELENNRKAFDISKLKERATQYKSVNLQSLRHNS